jgi:hypothetical protein
MSMIDRGISSIPSNSSSSVASAVDPNAEASSLWHSLQLQAAHQVILSILTARSLSVTATTSVLHTSSLPLPNTSLFPDALTENADMRLGQPVPPGATPVWRLPRINTRQDTTWLRAALSEPEKCNRPAILTRTPAKLQQNGIYHYCHPWEDYLQYCCEHTHAPSSKLRRHITLFPRLANVSLRRHRIHPCRRMH